MNVRRDATDIKLLGVSSRKGRRRRDPEHENQKPKHTEAGEVPRRQAGLSELHQSYSRHRSGECQKMMLKSSIGKIKGGCICPTRIESPDSEPNQVLLDQPRSAVRQWSSTP
jgi:hypothetical protein